MQGSSRWMGGVAALALAVSPLSVSMAQAQPGAVGGKEVAGLPTLAPLIDSVKAAVVNVEVVSRGSEEEEGGQGQEDSFDYFGRGGAPNSRRNLRQGAGSGFVIDAKGFILTNNHVVEGATSIRVKFDDGRAFDADVVGRDSMTDVALVKIRGNVGPLPTVKLGDSDTLRVGDWVVAIGNPFGLASSVSVGIISARARELRATSYDDFLQTDAAINPGNSGGPLFNLRGEVIGINTAIIQGGNGIGFAVPSNLVKALVPQLEKSGTVTRGYMGVGTQKLTPEIARALKVEAKEGALVTSVEPGSPSQKAGFQRDDIITSIDSQKVTTDAALRRIVALKPPGSTVAVTLVRSGKPVNAKVLLSRRPEEVTARNGRRTRPSSVSPDDEANNKQRIGLRLREENVDDPTLAKRLGLTRQGPVVVITDVTPGSAADRADLTANMVVVEANRQPVTGSNQLSNLIRSSKPGSTVLLRVVVPEAGGATQVRALTVPN